MTRNVVNTAEVDAFVAGLEQRSHVPEVREWLRATYRKWALKHAPFGEIVTFRTGDPGPAPATPYLAYDNETRRISPYTGPVPFWLDAALTRGDEVFRVHCGPALEQDAWLVIDWLNEQTGDAFFSRLARVSYPGALSEMRQWHAKLRQRKTAAERAGDTQAVQHFGDGYRVVQLKTPRALAIEGAMMGHCISSYTDELRHGTQLLSLRDPADQAHCTLEVRGRKVLQIKGKQNMAPAPKYRPYIRQFVSARGLRVVGDTDNIGPVLEIDGRPCGDVNEFIHLLNAAGGPKVWRRRGANPLDNMVDTQPLRLIGQLADEVSAESKGVLFAMLVRDFDAGVRFHRAVTMDVFGTAFNLIFVEYPFGLPYLRGAGVFVGRRHTQEIDRIIEQAMGSLLHAMKVRPNCLFGIKYRVADWSSDMPWDTDVVRASRLDMTRIRHERQMALRRGVSAARRENRRLLHDRSVPAWRRERWSADWVRIQDLLEYRAQEFL